MDIKYIAPLNNKMYRWLQYKFPMCIKDGWLKHINIINMI